MKKYIVYGLILITALILQLTVFASISLWGVKPDLLLVIITVFGLLMGIKTGAILGLSAGLLQDLFLGGFFGPYTIIKLILGTAAGFAGKNVYKKNYFFPSFLILMFTIIQTIIIIFLTENISFDRNLWFFIHPDMFIKSLYNALLGLMIYPVFYKNFINTGDKKTWIND